MRLRQHEKHYYIMLIPGLAWLLMFTIIPMFGNIIAFQDFNPVLGFFKSDWIAFDNFKYMFSLSDFRQILFNTMFIAVMKIIVRLLLPLIFALMLNEVMNTRMKRGIQTIVYLPHFLSWVILAGITMDLLSLNGPVNNFLELIHIKPILFLARSAYFRGILIISDAWKEYGYGAIIYIAALSSINPNLYEASAIDGATKLQQLWHVTLPGIKVTIILLATLSLGNVLNAGFEQIFNLYNPLVYSKGDIIDTWVYRTGIVNMDYGLATAVGIFKSLIGFILIKLSYDAAGKFANYRIF